LHDSFSNSTLWPLFHYHHGDTFFRQKDWDSYKTVNELFADVIDNLVQDVQKHIKTFKIKFKDIKIIFGVDCLDYTKGVPQKFYALDLFLSKNPEWIGKVVLVQVAKPSRFNTKEHQNLCQVVNELHGKINGKFISSIRDGMCLLPFEYISCQQGKHGVLILSEFAGAAQCLDDEFSDVIYEAVTMQEKLRKLNYQKLYRYVTYNTVSFWGKSFINELLRVKDYNSQVVIPHLEFTQVIKAAKSAKKRIILLDYDKTLITTHKSAEQTYPSNIIISILKTLQEKPNTYVYILSGRSRIHLDGWFESTGVGLSAEHGCFYKHPKCLQEKVNPTLNHERRVIKKENNGWYRLVKQVDPVLKKKVLHLFKHYVERSLGTSIEEKEIGIIWHNRCSNPEFGSRQTLDLQVNLMSHLARMPLNIILDDNILEIRSSLVDQSTVVRAIFKDLQVLQDYFVLCIGDEKPNEPVFSLLKENDEFKSLNCFTSTVGKKQKQTNATFYLEDIWDVRNLLEKLASNLSD
ncbi:11299_t:CDS:2, partial [Racocetra fulgida]